MTQEKVKRVEEKAFKYLLTRKQNKIMLLIPIKDQEKWMDYSNRWKKMLKKQK